jgi:hypothetical protein
MGAGKGGDMEREDMKREDMKHEDLKHEYNEREELACDHTKSTGGQAACGTPSSRSL